jgi:hypothetical protein
MSRYKTCIFDKKSKGFQRLDTDLGPFLISLAGINKYQNEYELSLNIGNPSMFEIPGFVLHVSWGKAFNPSGGVAYEDWQKSLKWREEKLREHLKAGRWNKIEISLGPAQPEELEYIRIGMVVDNIIFTSDTESHGAPTPSPKVQEWRTH